MVLIMDINAQRKTDSYIKGRHRSAAVAEKRQRDADNRQYAQIHTDVDNALKRDRRENADTDVATQQIIGPAGKGQQTDAHKKQKQNHRHAPDKAQRLADKRKNKIVVDFRHINMFACKQALAKSAAGTDGDFGVVLLI